ncbi:MAG: hypothetical protein ABFC80_06600 [Coriobacteriales bacterium]|nr:hypothetical protein [Actinomycetes bacterium]
MIPDSLDLDLILEANPQVDPDQLKKSIELGDQLKQAGIEPVGYRLASPLDSRRVQVADTKGQRRAIRLRAF